MEREAWMSKDLWFIPFVGVSFAIYYQFRLFAELCGKEKWPWELIGAACSAAGYGSGWALATLIGFEVKIPAWDIMELSLPGVLCSFLPLVVLYFWLKKEVADYAQSQQGVIDSIGKEEKQ